MHVLLRSMIAFPLFVMVGFGAASTAQAARPFADAYKVTDDTSFAGFGFLDFKTFLIGPTAADDPALASDRLRLISPETLMYDRARARARIPDPLADYPDLLPTVFAKPRLSAPESDALTIKVDGAPMTLRLGLGDTMPADPTKTFPPRGSSAPSGPTAGVGPARSVLEPTSLWIFAFGLLVMGWLRYALGRRRARQQP